MERQQVEPRGLRLRNGGCLRRGGLPAARPDDQEPGGHDADPEPGERARVARGRLRRHYRDDREENDEIEPPGEREAVRELRYLGAAGPFALESRLDLLAGRLQDADPREERQREAGQTEVDPERADRPRAVGDEQDSEYERQQRRRNEEPQSEPLVAGAQVAQLGRVARARGFQLEHDHQEAGAEPDDRAGDVQEDQKLVSAHEPVLHGQRSSFNRYSSKKLLKLESGAHVALDLELAGHVGRGGVQLALRDPLERLRVRHDRGVCVLGPLGHRDRSVGDAHRPLTGAVDVENVGVRHAGRLHGVDPGLEAVEECAHAVRRHVRGTLHHGVTSSGSSDLRARVDGRNAARASAATGIAAATYSAESRSMRSASAPTTTAPTPPIPIPKPTVIPEAMPMRCGRYSCPITMVTPKLPITNAPTSATATSR